MATRLDLEPATLSLEDRSYWKTAGGQWKTEPLQTATISSVYPQSTKAQQRRPLEDTGRRLWIFHWSSKAGVAGNETQPSQRQKTIEIPAEKLLGRSFPEHIVFDDDMPGFGVRVLPGKGGNRTGPHIAQYKPGF